MNNYIVTTESCDPWSNNSEFTQRVLDMAREYCTDVFFPEHGSNAVMISRYGKKRYPDQQDFHYCNVFKFTATKEKNLCKLQSIGASCVKWIIQNIMAGSSRLFLDAVFPVCAISVGPLYAMQHKMMVDSTLLQADQVSDQRLVGLRLLYPCCVLPTNTILKTWKTEEYISVTDRRLLASKTPEEVKSTILSEKKLPPLHISPSCIGLAGPAEFSHDMSVEQRTDILNQCHYVYLLDGKFGIYPQEIVDVINVFPLFHHLPPEETLTHIREKTFLIRTSKCGHLGELVDNIRGTSVQKWKSAQGMEFITFSELLVPVFPAWVTENLFFHWCEKKERDKSKTITEVPVVDYFASARKRLLSETQTYFGEMSKFMKKQSTVKLVNDEEEDQDILKDMLNDEGSDVEKDDNNENAEDSSDSSDSDESIDLANERGSSAEEDDDDQEEEEEEEDEDDEMTQKLHATVTNAGKVAGKSVPGLQQKVSAAATAESKKKEVAKPATVKSTTFNKTENAAAEKSKPAASKTKPAPKADLSSLRMEVTSTSQPSDESTVSFDDVSPGSAKRLNGTNASGKSQGKTAAASAEKTSETTTTSEAHDVPDGMIALSVFGEHHKINILAPPKIVMAPREPKDGKKKDEAEFDRRMALYNKYKEEKANWEKYKKTSIETEKKRLKEQEPKRLEELTKLMAKDRSAEKVSKSAASVSATSSERAVAKADGPKPMDVQAAAPISPSPSKSTKKRRLDVIVETSGDSSDATEHVKKSSRSSKHATAVHGNVIETNDIAVLERLKKQTNGNVTRSKLTQAADPAAYEKAYNNFTYKSMNRQDMQKLMAHYTILLLASENAAKVDPASLETYVEDRDGRYESLASVVFNSCPWFPQFGFKPSPESLKSKQEDEEELDDL
ncbi:MAG: hypothetical protein JSS82_14030 [Bacteroidetes bacterium]|nr:hypothetical protein [Bacteroidota bacterium]